MAWRSRAMLAWALLVAGFGALRPQEPEPDEGAEPLEVAPAEPCALPGLTARYAPDGVGNGAQELRLWLPGGERPERGFPVLVVLEGGGWREPSPLPEQPSATHCRYLGAGYAVALVRYTFTSTDFENRGAYPAPELDALHAIQHLRFRAAEYGLDGQRVIGLGRSAGAQGLLAAAYWPDRRDPQASGQAACSSRPDVLLCQALGAAHVPALRQRTVSGLARHLGAQSDLLADVPRERQLEASPLTWLAAAPDVARRIPVHLVSAAKPIEQPTARPFVENAVGHRHEPWNTAVLFAELQALGGVHPEHSRWLSLHETPLEPEAVDAARLLWLEQVLPLLATRDS
jgi:acetyl esterase/lipase